MGGNHQRTRDRLSTTAPGPVRSRWGGVKSEQSWRQQGNSQGEDEDGRGGSCAAQAIHEALDRKPGSLGSSTALDDLRSPCFGGGGAVTRISRAPPWLNRAAKTSSPLTCQPQAFAVIGAWSPATLCRWHRAIERRRSPGRHGTTSSEATASGLKHVVPATSVSGSPPDQGQSPIRRVAWRAALHRRGLIALGERRRAPSPWQLPGNGPDQESAP